MCNTCEIYVIHHYYILSVNIITFNIDLDSLKHKSPRITMQILRVVNFLLQSHHFINFAFIASSPPPPFINNGTFQIPAKYTSLALSTSCLNFHCIANKNTSVRLIKSQIYLNPILAFHHIGI